MIDCRRYDSSPECFTVEKSFSYSRGHFSFVVPRFYSASLCNNDQVPSPIRNAMFFISFCKEGLNSL